MALTSRAQFDRFAADSASADGHTRVTGFATTPHADVVDAQGCLYLLDIGVIWMRAHFFGELMARYSGTILVALDSMSLEVCVAGQAYRGKAIAIRPGVKHVVRASHGKYGCLRLTPLHPCFRQFSAIRSPSVVVLKPTMLKPFATALEAAIQGKLEYEPARQLLVAIGAAAALDLPRVRSPDARIARVLRILNDNPKCSVAELSAMFGVSADRMSHLFRESAGLPIQTYLRWQRMHRATALLERGGTLTEIAQAVGYTDVSHFGREIREIAGVSLSALFQNSQVKVCNWRQ